MEEKIIRVQIQNINKLLVKTCNNNIYNCIPAHLNLLIYQCITPFLVHNNFYQSFIESKSNDSLTCKAVVYIVSIVCLVSMQLK